MKEEKIMAAAIGFLMIIVIVALLLKGKMSPIVVLAIVPTISALILGFVPTDILGFIADGIKTTTSNGILFIFSVIYNSFLLYRKFNCYFSNEARNTFH